MQRSVPRFLDREVEGKVTDVTRQKYRKAVGKFMHFIIKFNFRPVNANHIDDLLVEWKYMQSVSKSDFETAVAGIEYAIPQFKGELRWSRQVIKSWCITHVARHTVPMTEPVAAFLGCTLASMGHQKLGAGVIIQHAAGLRPTELVNLQFEDVVLPEDRNQSGAQSHVVLGLGMRTGTKAKRAQSVLIFASNTVSLLRWLKQLSSPHEKVIPYTYEQYRRLLVRACDRVGLAEMGFTPH